jgi:hypothetical protein
MATIHIALEGNELVYHPPLLHAGKGSSIEWICDAPFVIQFKGISPLERSEFRSGDTRIPVRPDAAPGPYEYAVAVYAEGRVYLDASCPAIIID